MPRTQSRTKLTSNSDGSNIANTNKSSKVSSVPSNDISSINNECSSKSSYKKEKKTC